MARKEPFVLKTTWFLCNSKKDFLQDMVANSEALLKDVINHLMCKVRQGNILNRFEGLLPQDKENHTKVPWGHRRRNVSYALNKGLASLWKTRGL